MHMIQTTTGTAAADAAAKLSDAIQSLPHAAAVEVYTDGAAEPSNPGPTGAAFVLVATVDGAEVGFQSRHLGWSTNNVGEMTAALDALEALSDRTDLSITIIADSQYVVKGMTEWLPRWKAKGWRAADGKPVKNRELWEKLDALAGQFPKLAWRWTRGHAGDRWNERADQLANAATKALVVMMEEGAGVELC